MADIIIKKRVSLDFLGEDYANSYIVFKSLPIEEYQKVQDEVEKIPKGGFTKYLVDFLKDRLIEGKLDQDGGQTDITKENIGQLDFDAISVCYKHLTGQIDPKV